MKKIRLYKMLADVDFISTARFSRQKWLNLRTTGIGGSDAGAILGLNKYSSPLSVYLAKKNLISEENQGKTSSNESIRWGKMAESAIRKGIADDLGLRIEEVPGMFRSREYPFMNANLDGLVFTDGEREVFGSVISGLGGIEIKTTTERNHEFREDEVPDSYYCQVQHYMAVTGLEWFILVVMIGKVDGRGYVIRRDDAFIPGMIEAESHFWFDNVCRDIPPPPTGNERESELLNSLYESSGSVSLPDEYEEKLREYEEIAEKIRELKTRQEIIKEEIKLAVSGQSDDGTETEKVTATVGGYTVVWSKQTRRVVDTAALRKANLFDSYSKESTSFVMRIRGEKEKE